MLSLAVIAEGMAIYGRSPPRSGLRSRFTLAMLVAVNHILASGAKLEEELLRSQFQSYREKAKTTLKDLALAGVRDLPSLKGIIDKFL